LISDIPGYLYVLHLGSDKKTFTLLFPNKHEEFNDIPANTKFQIPGPNWTLKAKGPEGKTHMLAIVSKTKLDLAHFGLSNLDFFVSEDARIENRGALTHQFSRNSAGNRTLSFSANFFSVEETK